MEGSKMKELGRDALIAVLGAVVGGVVSPLVASYIHTRRSEQITVISSPIDVKRAELEASHQLLIQMYHEAGDAELSALGHDAIMYRNRFSDELYQEGLEERSSAAGRDDLFLTIEMLNSEISVYPSDCPEGITTHANTWNLCETVARFYLEPTIGAASGAVQRRIDQFKP